MVPVPVLILVVSWEPIFPSVIFLPCLSVNCVLGLLVVSTVILGQT